MKSQTNTNNMSIKEESPKKELPSNGKKTKGRVRIKMEFIHNKLRRYTTFSKRKTGIMKKAFELATLTGTQVMLLVASETGHVYTFATRKLQPMIISDAGKALIQTCLNSPDSDSLLMSAAAAAAAAAAGSTSTSSSTGSGNNSNAGGGGGGSSQAPSAGSSSTSATSGAGASTSGATTSQQPEAHRTSPKQMGPGATIACPPSSSSSPSVSMSSSAPISTSGSPTTLASTGANQCQQQQSSHCNMSHQSIQSQNNVLLATNAPNATNSSQQQQQQQNGTNSSSNNSSTNSQQNQQQQRVNQRLGSGAATAPTTTTATTTATSSTSSQSQQQNNNYQTIGHQQQQTSHNATTDQRMSATGFEETDLSYSINDDLSDRMNLIGEDSILATTFTSTNLSQSSSKQHLRTSLKMIPFVGLDDDDDDVDDDDEEEADDVDEDDIIGAGECAGAADSLEGSLDESRQISARCSNKRHKSSHGTNSFAEMAASMSATGSQQHDGRADRSISSTSTSSPLFDHEQPARAARSSGNGDNSSDPLGLLLEHSSPPQTEPTNGSDEHYHFGKSLGHQPVNSNLAARSVDVAGNQRQQHQRASSSSTSPLMMAGDNEGNNASSAGILLQHSHHEHQQQQHQMHHLHQTQYHIPTHHSHLNQEQHHLQHYHQHHFVTSPSSQQFQREDQRSQTPNHFEPQSHLQTHQHQHNQHPHLHQQQQQQQQQQSHHPHSDHNSSNSSNSHDAFKSHDPMMDASGGHHNNLSHNQHQHHPTHHHLPRSSAGTGALPPFCTL